MPHAPVQRTRYSAPSVPLLRHLASPHREVSSEPSALASPYAALSPPYSAFRNVDILSITGRGSLFPAHFPLPIEPMARRHLVRISTPLHPVKSRKIPSHSVKSHSIDQRIPGRTRSRPRRLQR
eukprot:4526275-Pyramimonas_sp.AAC.1